MKTKYAKKLVICVKNGIQRAIVLLVIRNITSIKDHAYSGIKKKSHLKLILKKNKPKRQVMEKA